MEAQKELLAKAMSQMSHEEFSKFSQVLAENLNASLPVTAIVTSDEEPTDSTTQSLLAQIGSHGDEDGEERAGEDGAMPFLKKEEPEDEEEEDSDDVSRTPKRCATDDDGDEGVAAKKSRPDSLEESPTSSHSDTSDSSTSPQPNPSEAITDPSAILAFLQKMNELNPNGMPIELCEVPSRLSLLTSSHKNRYKMTVDEIRRRVDGAESFNISLLGALLRRAKTPHMSENLTDQLKVYGLDVPKGRRRKTNLTLFSALAEGESLKLADDFKKLSSELFPAAELAVYANDHQRRGMDQLQAFRNQIQTFLDLLRKDGSHVHMNRPLVLLDSSVQNPLSYFSLLSHGFGTPGILVGVETMLAFVDAQITQLAVANAQGLSL